MTCSNLYIGNNEQMQMMMRNRSLHFNGVSMTLFDRSPDKKAQTLLAVDMDDPIHRVFGNY